MIKRIWQGIKDNKIAILTGIVMGCFTINVVLYGMEKNWGAAFGFGMGAFWCFIAYMNDRRADNWRELALKSMTATAPILIENMLLKRLVDNLGGGEVENTDTPEVEDNTQVH